MLGVREAENAMTSTSFAQNRCFSSMFFLKLSSRSRSGGVRGRMCDDVDEFLGCKSKFDDSGPETMERGGDFYFGVVAPTPGDLPSSTRALPLGGVRGASSL